MAANSAGNIVIHQNFFSGTCPSTYFVSMGTFNMFYHVKGLVENCQPKSSAVVFSQEVSCNHFLDTINWFNFLSPSCLQYFSVLESCYHDFNGKNNILIISKDLSDNCQLANNLCFLIWCFVMFVWSLGLIIQFS